MEYPRELVYVFNAHKDMTVEFRDESKKYVLEIKNPCPDGKNNSVDRIFHYRGKNKRRVITSVSAEMPSGGIPGGMQITDEAEMLMEQCDYFFVVDTNYKPWNGRFLCVGAIGALVWVEEKMQYAICPVCNLRFEIEAHPDPNPKTGKPEPIINPERFTWAWLVKKIVENPKMNDSRIVILVDSEADQLKQFNDGQEIYDGVKLPSNARFVYATANKKDTMLNWAIIQCDKAASRLLTEYMNK